MQWNEVSKIYAKIGQDFTDIIYIEQRIEEQSYAKPDVFKTEEYFKTIDVPNLEARNITYYAKKYIEYKATILLNSQIHIDNLMIAEYLIIQFVGGSKLEHIFPIDIQTENNIEKTEISKITFTFRLGHSLNVNEFSYLTFPEIKNVVINKLQYFKGVEIEHEFFHINGYTYSIFDSIPTELPYQVGEEFNILTNTNQRFTVKFENYTGGKYIINIQGNYPFVSFYEIRYIYTKLMSQLDNTATTRQTLDINDKNFFTRTVDFNIIKNRFYLTLEQKTDLERYLHFQTASDVVYIDYTYGTFISLDQIAAKCNNFDKINNLYSFDLQLKYAQY